MEEEKRSSALVRHEKEELTRENQAGFVQQNNARCRFTHLSAQPAVARSETSRCHPRAPQSLRWPPGSGRHSTVPTTRPRSCGWRRRPLLHSGREPAGGVNGPWGSVWEHEWVDGWSGHCCCSRTVSYIFLFCRLVWGWPRPNCFHWSLRCVASTLILCRDQSNEFGAWFYTTGQCLKLLWLLNLFCWWLLFI